MPRNKERSQRATAAFELAKALLDRHSYDEIVAHAATLIFDASGCFDTSGPARQRYLGAVEGASKILFDFTQDVEAERSVKVAATALWFANEVFRADEREIPEIISQLEYWKLSLDPIPDIANR